MKKQQNNSTRGWALLIALSIALLSISAVLLASSNGIWSVTGSLNTAREYYTATLLPNGKVLVAGGLDDSLGVLASAELYDPATGTWTFTGSLNTARLAHTATLLPNGKVLVAGGFNGDAHQRRTVRSGKRDLDFHRQPQHRAQYHTATLLPNGKVLVAGG